MTTKTCKKILKNGQPCPNQVDEGQDFCPYHLSGDMSLLRKILAGFISGLSVLVAVAWAIIKLIGDNKKGA